MAFPASFTNAVDDVLPGSGTPITAALLNNLEIKVGIDASAAVTSLDYLLKNTASIEPGHKHSKLWAVDGSPQSIDIGSDGNIVVYSALTYFVRSAGAPWSAYAFMQIDTTKEKFTIQSMVASVPGGLLLNPEGGNVGIGLSDALVPLEVYSATGNTPTLTAADAGGIFCVAAGTDFRAVMGHYATSPYGFYIQNRHHHVDGIAYPILLNPLGGNVGIGTLAPIGLLSVITADGSGDVNVVMGNDQTNKFGVISYNDTSDFLSIQGGVWNGVTRPLIMQGGGGNVGIGTLQPAAKLDVVGTTRLGDSATNYVNVGATGNMSFVGSAGFYPRLLSQNAEPAAGTGATELNTGELAVWNDTDSGTEIWIVYNDAGTIKGIKIE